MIPLKQVQIGWKALENIVNKIIDYANRSVPIEGDGIRIVDAPNGKVISIAAQTQGSGVGGSGTTITEGGGGGPDGGPTEGGWMTVTIVDPTTCAQSQIQVWSRPVP